MSWRPTGREHPGEEKEFSWLPDGDMDAADRAYASSSLSLAENRIAAAVANLCDDGYTEPFGGWDMVWPEDIADAPETTDTAPEPPRTPEQPTVATSRVTPPKDTPRELLDTRIVPRALWAADEGLRQEQALQIVAIHDAGCVLQALYKVEAQRTMAAALLNWNRHTNRQHATQLCTQQADRDTHTVVYSLGQLPTHAVLMKRYLDLLAPPVQTAAAITQPQQAQPQPSHSRSRSKTMSEGLRLALRVDDAGFLLDTLAEVLSQWPNGVAAALAGWKTAQARGQPPQQTTTQAVLQDKQKTDRRRRDEHTQQQPQDETRQQQRQQDHLRKVDEAQRQQQQWVPKQQRQRELSGRTKPGNPHCGEIVGPFERTRSGQTIRCHKSIAEKRVYLRKLEADAGPDTWDQIQRLADHYDDHNLSDVVHYLTMTHFPGYYNTSKILQEHHDRMTTLEANSPRAGDDWAD
jgi:hypothetical protein